MRMDTFELVMLFIGKMIISFSTGGSLLIVSYICMGYLDTSTDVLSYYSYQERRRKGPSY